MTLSPSLALPTGKGVAGHESGRRLRPHPGGGGRPGKPRPGLRRCVRRKRYCSCSRAAAVADRGKSEARNEGQARNLDSEYQFPGPASAEPAHSTTRCGAAASTWSATTARQLLLPFGGRNWVAACSMNGPARPACITSRECLCICSSTLTHRMERGASHEPETIPKRRRSRDI